VRQVNFIFHCPLLPPATAKVWLRTHHSRRRALGHPTLGSREDGGAAHGLLVLSCFGSSRKQSLSYKLSLSTVTSEELPKLNFVGAELCRWLAPSVSEHLRVRCETRDQWGWPSRLFYSRRLTLVAPENKIGPTRRSVDENKRLCRVVTCFAGGADVFAKTRISCRVRTYFILGAGEATQRANVAACIFL